MNIKTILVSDKTNPVEVQTWLTANSSVTIISTIVSDNMFYIIYK